MRQSSRSFASWPVLHSSLIFEGVAFWPTRWLSSGPSWAPRPPPQENAWRNRKRTRTASPRPPPPIAIGPPLRRRPRASVTWPGSSLAPRRKRTAGYFPLADGRQTLEAREEGDELAGALHEDVGCGSEAWRPLLGGDRDADEVLEPCGGQPREGVEVGRVVARVQAEPRLRLGEKGCHGCALVGRDRRADLEHLAAPARVEPCAPSAFGNLFELRPRRGLVLG